MWDTFIVYPLTNVLLWIYQFVGGNFGVAIIIFTILIRLVTHPLMASQIKSSQGLQELQKSKKWQDIQKKYKGDKEKLAQEQMAIYKEMGINPFGSCLPTLIQLPIIFGLYQSIMLALAASPSQLLILTRSIYSMFDITKVIPLNSNFLWMNLGQPERLYLSFLPTIGIPLLAVIVAITSYFQQKLITPPTTNPGDQTGNMSKMMNIYMPLLMGYFAMTYASGLAIYFIASNLVGIVQYAALGKLDWRNLLPKSIKGEVKPK
ncbi:MAG TPA: YidC/Oxa1 family membrane protein insertase [Anaerolineales bacterium]|nr:YidC/Oxa1 family membrane protein insertase [Anaerolineales bacterium]